VQITHCSTCMCAVDASVPTLQAAVADCELAPGFIQAAEDQRSRQPCRPGWCRLTGRTILVQTIATRGDLCHVFPAIQLRCSVLHM
jgi:hypothetical protein